MKLFYLSLILFLSFILFQFLSCITEPEVNNPPPQTNIIVSGQVFELNQSGTFPSDSCKLIIITSNDTSLIITNGSGLFADTLISEDDHIQLVLEKDGFITIDTTVQSSSTQNLIFTISFNRIEISGILYEINASGTYPFPNCEIKIYSGIWPTGNWNIIYSNNLGYFEFQTTNFHNSVRIIVDLVSYVLLDTTVTIQNSTSLELFLEKYVNYFPLKIGSKWQYSGEYYAPGDFFWYDYEGVEWWELTELSSDSSWFKIVTDFSGMKIEKHWGTPGDTIYLYNEVCELQINNRDGIFYLQAATGSDISLLRWFFYWLNRTSITEPRVIHPISSADTLSVFIEQYHDFLKYDIIRNVGFDILHVQHVTPLPDWISVRLDLQDYINP